MTPLPKDVLVEIFLYLNQFDKRECMLVCQYWKQIIEEYALYNSITLCTSSNLNKFTEKIQKQPEIGKSVRCFATLLQHKSGDIAHLKELLVSFPNLRVLFFSTDRIGHNHALFDNKHQCPWSESISCIKDNTKVNPISYQVLSSYVCRHLSTLSTFLDERNEIIELLHNAPGIRNLTLRLGYIGLYDLDTVHSKLPLLESLALYHIVFNDHKYTGNIIPVTSVTQCHFIQSGAIKSETVIDLLDYIPGKYTNLTELDFSADFTNLLPELHDMIDVNTWRNLFQPKLKTLHLDVILENDTFVGALVESKCEINYLNIPFPFLSFSMSDIADSQQINYIQTLALTDVTSIDSFDWLCHLVVLKKLKLTGFSSKFISLKDSIHHAPPTMISLTIKCCVLDLQHKYNRSSHLEYLSFHKVRIPKIADDYFHQHFPKLRTLKSKYCENMFRTVFRLPTTSLFTFRLDTHHPLQINSVLIKTNNESRLYSLKNSICFREKATGHSYERPYKSHLVKRYYCLSLFYFAIPWKMYFLEAIHICRSTCMKFIIIKFI